MSQPPIVSRRILAAGVLASGLTIAGVNATSASAATFSESWSGSVPIYGGVNRTNTFWWRNPHGNFSERFWVKADGWFLSTKYTIAMFDASGRQVWRAENQGDRTYTIGGNVTRIVVSTNAVNGVNLNWRRS